MMKLDWAIYRVEQMIEIGGANSEYVNKEDLQDFNADLEALNIAKECMGIVKDLHTVKGILEDKELGVYDDVE